MSTLVHDKSESTRVPFLRGILTRSLLDAGLDFDEAYKVADRVRGLIADEKEVSTEELRELVEKQLGKRKDKDVLERYLRRGEQGIPITIIDREGQPQPFSKAHLGQTLEICAFPTEKRYAVTAAIEQQLLQSGSSEVSSTDLAELTYQHLLDHEEPENAHRYLTWVEFSRGGRPLLLLVGGTTGCGKSTISSEIAHRLNIVRAQSTDMLREVMRLMLPERLVPALHTSSYNAWTTLPTTHEGTTVTSETHMETGYLAQSRQVSIGVEAVMRRAEREHVSMIIEGVHVYPELQQHLKEESDAIVVPIVLAVLKKKKLRKQLKGRGQQVSSRRSERYLAHFESIWRLQSFLISEADHYGIPIIPNTEQTDTVQLVMDTIAEVLQGEYSGSAKHVFAA